MYANQEMIHGKIATCDTKTMEDAFIVKGSGAPNNRMFPNTSELRRETNGFLHALEICMVKWSCDP